MCLEALYLVAPKEFPNPEATARASGAEDVLSRARVCATLDEALREAHLVIGSSGRARRIEWPPLDPQACAAKVVQEAARLSVALVFGPERTGLTNAELDRCHFLVRIPANDEYPSLNLAGAVQVLAYEIFRAAREHAGGEHKRAEILATHEEMRLFYRHLRDVLVRLKFLDPANPRHLMRRLIRLFNRARLDQKELNILRGILTAIEQSRHKVDRGDRGGA